MTILDGMRQKKENSTKLDRHKCRRMVAIRKVFHEPADKLIAKLGCSNLTELANVAMREFLEKNGEWPPQAIEKKT